jgi:hypothetical protein
MSRSYCMNELRCYLSLLFTYVEALNLNLNIGAALSCRCQLRSISNTTMPCVHVGN